MMSAEMSPEFDVTTSVSSVTKSFPMTYSTVSVVFNTAAGLAIFVLNALCFLSIISQGLHNEEIKFLFMAAYAAIDSLLGLCSIVQNLVVNLKAVYNHLDSVETVCFVTSSFIEALTKADTFCLLLLTVDQYMRIRLHMRYPLYATKRNAYIGLGLMSMVVAANVIALNVIMWHRAAQGCVSYGELSVWYDAYNQIVMFVIPLLAITAMHGRIFYMARKQLKKSRTLQGQVRMDHHPSSSVGSRRENTAQNYVSSTSSKRQWKAVVTLTVLVGILLVTWTPVNIVTMLFWLSSPIELQPYMVELFILFFYLNFLLNPVVYILRIPEVKRGIGKLMGKFC